MSNENTVSTDTKEEVKEVHDCPNCGCEFTNGVQSHAHKFCSSKCIQEHYN